MLTEAEHFAAAHRAYLEPPAEPAPDPRSLAERFDALSAKRRYAADDAFLQLDGMELADDLAEETNWTPEKALAFVTKYRERLITHRRQEADRNT